MSGDRFTVPDSLFRLFCEGVAPRESLLVFCYLCRESCVTGEVRASHAVIAEATGLSVRTVQNHLVKLAERCVVKITRHSGGVCSYQILSDG